LPSLNLPELMEQQNDARRRMGPALSLQALGASGDLATAQRSPKHMEYGLIWIATKPTKARNWTTRTIREGHRTLDKGKA